MTPAAAAERIRERFGVEATVEGSTLTVVLPRERGREGGAFARAERGCPPGSGASRSRRWSGWPSKTTPNMS